MAHYPLPESEARNMRCSVTRPRVGYRPLRWNRGSAQPHHLERGPATLRHRTRNATGRSGGNNRDRAPKRSSCVVIHESDRVWRRTATDRA